jgi:hypothetical protein
MTRHLRVYVAQAVGYFALGVLTDVGVTLYYRAISSGLLLPAVGLSFLVTIIPFVVAEQGIINRRRSLFLWYALGCAVGTALGMLVHIQ